MPTPGKPSLNLYQRLGEDVVNELVEWFGQVDAAYRSELRDLNEANAHRFETLLNQRAGQLETKIEQVEQRLEAKLERRLTEVSGDLKHQIAGVQAELIKWTFLFWLGTIGIVVLLLGRS